MKTVYVST